ncbi:MAG: hypothetical protein ACJ76H_01835 [Bacteriovoracaceae bacterium]
MWFFLFLPLFVFAQSDPDLSAISDLEKILPENDIPKSSYKNIEFERKHRGFRPPVRKVSMEEILSGGDAPGFVKKGTIIYRLKDNSAVTLSRDIYLKFFVVQDELNFQYLKNNDGTCTYRVPSQYVNSIALELELYEPPRKFTPVIASDIPHTEYDKKLRLVPEAAFYTGYVQSQFIRDLFNDSKAGAGTTNQYGLHYFTEWNLPVKVGGSVHYERASYALTGKGSVFYDAISFGPQVRTKDFDLFETNWRVTGQIRVSPFAKLRGETTRGPANFKFNSTDFMTTFEHPWKNRIGQFVVGGFYQMQWLNIKDAPEAVSIRASNQINQSLGLFIGQVFE